MKLPRFKYSLSTLFILFSIASVVFYWWFALPTLNARQFVVAVDSRNFDAAEEMLEDPFLASWFHVTDARLEPLTWRQILRGERVVAIGEPESWAHDADTVYYSSVRVTSSQAVWLIE